MKASIGVSAGPVRVSQGLGLGGGFGGLCVLGGIAWVASNREIVSLAVLVVVAVIVITGLVGGIANDIRRYRKGRAE